MPGMLNRLSVSVPPVPKMCRQNPIAVPTQVKPKVQPVHPAIATSRREFPSVMNFSSLSGN